MTTTAASGFQGGGCGGVGIFVVASFGSGHLFPCVELCKHFSFRNYITTLVLPSSVQPLLPSSFHRQPLLRTAQIAGFHFGPPSPQLDQARHQAEQDLQAHLSSHRPLCAVVDFQMAWTKHIFWKFDVPVVSFFTFGACAAAMEWGSWKSDAGNLNPGEVRSIPGLPEDMSVDYHDLKRGRRRGGPNPGNQPPWVPLIEGSIGLMFNTSNDLERPFLDYIAEQLGLPVWAVGPLLPEQYWNLPSGSLIRDRAIRQPKSDSSHTEEEVIHWLDAKPRKSVLYVSFGSETGPTMEEYPQLAGALEDSTHAFIWVIQAGSGLPKFSGSGPPSTQEGYLPNGVASKFGHRGLIIKGWAPQLLILSHPSTAGFLSHCGWNSVAEAAGLGVPFLAWPIRGDQIFNAKLVVKHLEIGYMALGEGSLDVAKAKKDIVEGMERLMSDPEIHRRAERIRAKLEDGFPASSKAALDAFLRDFIRQNAGLS